MKISLSGLKSYLAKLFGDFCLENKNCKMISSVISIKFDDFVWLI